MDYTLICWTPALWRLPGQLQLLLLLKALPLLRQPLSQESAQHRSARPTRATSAAKTVWLLGSPALQVYCSTHQPKTARSMSHLPTARHPVRHQAVRAQNVLARGALMACIATRQAPQTVWCAPYRGLSLSRAPRALPLSQGQGVQHSRALPGPPGALAHLLLLLVTPPALMQCHLQMMQPVLSPDQQSPSKLLCGMDCFGYLLRKSASLALLWVHGYHTLENEAIMCE